MHPPSLKRRLPFLGARVSASLLTVTLGSLLSNATFAASLLALDFNEEAPSLPAMESFSSEDSVRAAQAVASVGTIDIFRGSSSGAATLTVDATAARNAWDAGLRTPLLPIGNAEATLAKLTLAFDLQASQPRPVRVRIASFDAERKCGGGLEKWVYPPVAGSFYRHSLDLSEMTAWKGKFDPAAPFIQLSWEIASDAPQPWPKADGHLIRVDNVSLAAPSFYVSASGSDKVDGRTEATAFQTIQKGIAAAQAGDTVLVLDGTYALGGGVNWSTIGAPAKWITLKRAPGAKPRVEFNGWAGFTIKKGSAFLEINGLEIVGNARNVTLEEATENGRAEKPDGKFNGTAISIEGKTLEDGKTVKDEAPHRDRPDRPHHIRIVGCHIHDACGAGVAAMLADYLTVEGNVVTDCAARSRYAHSGITMYWAWNFDASTEHRNFIRNNVVARNRTMVAWLPPWEKDKAKAHVSDGNGIIVDDFIQHQPGGPGEPNAGRTLVQNNLAHHNGAGGVHVFASDRVDVVNNTTFANCQTDIIDYGEIDTSWAKDCRVINNVAVASPGKTVHRNRSRENKPEPSNVWEANVLFADGVKKVRDFSERDVWADPLLAAPTPDAPATAFALQPASPARQGGQDSRLVCGLDLLGILRPSAGRIDGGAIQSTAAAQASTRSATAPKRIYLANDDHTDFQWTADADTYANVFVEMLDWHLKLADETQSNAPPYRHRFNCDGSYWLWHYEQKKTPAQFARLIGRIKDGTISAPLNLLVSCYGGQPAEAVLRGMYYAGRLERRHDLRFPMAVAMENQTLPLGLASLFAGSGARYSWRGVCGCATRMDKKALGERPREIFWWTGHDGQRLLLKWYSQAGPGLGGYWEAGSPTAAIHYVDGDAGFLKRHVDPKTRAPFQVAGIFGYGGDDLARKTGVAPPPEIPGVPGLSKIVSSPYRDHFHVIAQKESNERRQVIVSNEQDFFADFEQTHGVALDSQAVTSGNEWDLYSASMSETSARAKRAVEKLRSAEVLAALVSLQHSTFMDRHTAARDRAFNGLGLFWEHNWTADGPISRPQRAAWQEEVVTGIEAYVNSIHGEALVRLGGMVPRPEKANRFFVLNPLGWPRTEAADFVYQGTAEIKVRDLTTGQEVPHQIVKIAGARHLRILASEVPSAGYKVFEILAGKGTAAGEDAATVSGEGGATFENDAVKLVLERDGAIRSFIDKRRGNVELVGTIDGLKLNDFAAHSDDGEPLRVENRGPVSVTLRARSEAGLDHTTAITLYRGSERIDIQNELTANFNNVRHWAFTFALSEPALRTEEIGAINLNKVRAAGGDYADTHARYDYLTVNHFADFTDGSGARGVTISNPDLAFAKLGYSTPYWLDASTPQLHLLAGGQVDGSWLGIPAQNGQTHFRQRFALRPHGAYEQTSAMKFALEHQNPFVTGAVITKEGGKYPETTFSLLAVSNPDVLLWALKVHEDGLDRGLVARLWNVSDGPAEAELTLPSGVSAAHRTTHLETDLEAVALRDNGSMPAVFQRQQMQTYRLLLK